MRGDIVRIDLYAHSLRLWGKRFADNCVRKAKRNRKANEKKFIRSRKLLWLSVSGIRPTGRVRINSNKKQPRTRFIQKQGTYMYAKNGPLE